MTENFIFNKLFHANISLRFNYFNKWVESVAACFFNLPLLFYVITLLLVTAGSAESQTNISGNITSDATWTLEGSPYYISSEVVVGPPEATAPSVTLIIEPGVSIYFAAGDVIGGLIVAQKGILIARGSQTQPVQFDRYLEHSSQWLGIKFSSDIESTDSVIENCTIQNASVAIGYEKGGVQILSNAIMSNSTGVSYISEGPTFDLILECNHFNNCFYAVSCYRGNVVDQVKQNVFENSYIDIYGPQGNFGEFHAENNYFPTYSGNVGNVYIEPQLTDRPACVPNFDNSPPNAPHDPTPADGAFNIEGFWNGYWQSTLSWSCSDPDTDDVLSYSIDLGTDPANLNSIGTSNEASIIYSYLLPSTTYYWRVTAHDQFSAEISGPVWQFTTAVTPIDLTVTEVTWSPESVITVGQDVTLTVTITNSGTVPVEDPFWVAIAIDGTTIGTQEVNATIGVGEIRQVSIVWTAEPGSHTLSVATDSANNLDESDETNNELSIDLPVVDFASHVDLKVIGIHGPAETFFEIGKQTTIYADILNSGPDSLSAMFSVEFFVDGESIGIETVSTVSPELGPGETIQVAHPWTPASSGDHSITATVDSSNDVIETDESNNLLDTTLHVEAVDLVVESLTWEPSSDLEEGDDITLTARVRNDGPDTLTVNSCAVNFAMDGADLGNMWFSETVLEAGGTLDVVFDTTVYAGDQTIVATVDSTDTIAETDEENNALSADLPEITDNNPPEDITGLTVTDSEKTLLSFSWSHSANTVGDLVGYKVYFNGATEGELLPATQSTYQKSGLSSATAYDIRVTAYDGVGNESDGLSVTGYTALENPAGLIASSRPAFVDLSWEPSSPETYVDYYAVFLSTDDFLTVEGMTANTTITETSVSIGPLDSDSTYHFAVVAVNLSGGMDEAVTTLAASPLPGTAVSGNITANTTWTVENSPYVVTGDITVYHTSSSTYSNTTPNQRTLTIEPGVEVRFEPGTGLILGKHSSGSWGFHGALSAQGTADDPVVFTSNASTPMPGDWKGIYFHNATYDAGTLMEHCVVEYGGYTHNADISVYDSSPTIRDCTIRHSSGHGIYLDYDTGAAITGNTFTSNAVSAVNVHPHRAHLLAGNTGSGEGENFIWVRGGNITANRTWKKQATGSLPYVVMGDITVYHTSSSTYSNTTPNQRTLTIEPGVEVRFEPGTGLILGKHSSGSWGFHGALSAQGTADDPVVFTSNASTPMPGDWKGIYFHNATYDAGTLMEHCVVEYGGYTHNADIYISYAKPTLQTNTIRNSSHSGVYVTGNGSDGATIDCNNFKDNLYGIYTADGAQPSISGNNFLRNQNYGVYNAHSQTVTANGNWWNDASGPNTNGDATFGTVTVDTWLTAESDCVTAPPTNSAPYEPRGPSPENGAVRVAILEEGESVPVTLSWSGGDPNPWDTVVYDLYFGTASDALTLTAESLEIAAYDVDGLTGGTTYYWQVVSRDDVGAETIGPVWSFTTLGDPPDLEVTQISWNPTEDLTAGQSVTLIATIANSGSGPVVDAFKVAFAIDGATVGTRTISPVIPAGETRQVSVSWTAAKGNHTLTVTADSGAAVDESYEENNTLSETLPLVTDTTPPTLESVSPSNGAILQELSSMSMTLADAHGTIDDAAVIASAVLIDGGGQAVSGSTTEDNDVFTFTPATLPLSDGAYTFSLDAVDDSGNTAQFGITFTIDAQVPAAPTLTGGEILSGTLAVRPAQNRANASAITVTGTREDDTAVYINNSVKAVLGSGNWTTTVDLAQGDNTLEIWVQDAAGNRSDSLFADVAVDSVAPSISAVVPAADSFLDAPPAAVTIAYTETGSGLNIANCTRSLKMDGVEISGIWDFATAGTIVFTPTTSLTDGLYTLSVQLEDNFTNRSPAVNRQFTVDTLAPAAPVIDAVTTPTHNPNQTITGTKEAYAAILLEGAEVIGHTAATTWSHDVSLASGENSFVFSARDRAGNTGETATAVIVFDDIAPDPVTTLAVNSQASGTAAALNWSGYDEAAHGDVSLYRIYWNEGASFSDVASMTAQATVPAGTFTYTATGLTKGATVWFAVVAVDVMGNVNTGVTAVSCLLEDVEAPENVTGLTVDSQADSLTFSWTASANSVGDLAGYRVYVDGASDYTALTTDQLSFELTGLAAASAHTFRVTAVDDAADPNESSGAAITGVTWLPNPTGLAGEPFSGYVQLSWSAAEPTAYVKNYRVYVHTSTFTDVSAMTPAVTTSGTTAKVAGLTNGETYWFAVTTMNTSNGENPAVTAISATPEEDILGPELSDLLAGGVAFADGYELTGPVTLSLSAADPTGVSRIEFYLDGTLLRTDYASPYTCYLDPADMDDGSHQLTITAYDTLDNSTSLTIAFTVALALPEAPTITSPTDGTTTNKPQVVVSGEAEADATVTLYNNALGTGVSGTADGKGHFSMILTLDEGENSIQASATNRSGEGPLSAAVAVTLDTTLPSAPGAVTAEARAGGEIRIGWQKPSDSVVSGYNLYRSAAEFSDVAQAEKVNTGTIVDDKYDDLPASDGTWYYRVTSLDTAGNESEPSVQVFATSDSIAPRATAIVYTPEGPYDDATGTMAPGTVDLELTVSEALQATPFLSITPSGGTPISVDLVQVDETTYSGFFVISETTPSGSAWAVFSARDTVGNRGTEIDAGGVIGIDTAGPSVSRLEVSPASPIRNDVDDPVTVTAVLGLSEAVKAGTLPEVGYLLSGEGRETTEVDSLTQLATADGDAQTFQAVFTLPSDAGAADSESLSLTFSAVDALDNLGTDIDADNRFQVYQGELPPLDAPDGLTGTALPGGRVLLAWNPVDEAVAYQVYRQAPDETELTAFIRLDDGSLIEYEDATEVDGDYTYAVTSIRSENGQEAESGLSETVTVSADSVAPGVPTDFALELVANGIKATWTPPAYTEPITYSIYRAPDTEITSVDGLDPLAEGIAQTLVVDPNPSDDDHCYTVTAVDEAGNESAPATSAYLNFDLLPVSSLQVVQSESDPPVLSWTHSGSTIAGYHIYLGGADDGVPLNGSLVTDLSYTDIGWVGDDRSYTVVAVDTDGVPSLGRSIVLPSIEATLADDAVVRRGLMNQLAYTVENRSESAVDNIRLQVVLGGRTHYSETFSLAAGARDNVTVVVGGYADLVDPADLTTTIEITPGTNESVNIVRSGQVTVGDGMLVLQIANDTFTRGGSGTVWFTLENTGDEEIEIVTARNSGNSDSNRIAFTLLDEDENVITAKAFRQGVGDAIVTLSDKRSVARIGAGEIFTAAATTIDVPSTAPDDVIVRLSIGNVYYHLGQATEVSMTGLSTTHTVNLEETAYIGRLDAIDPETSSGDEDIVITGQATERLSGDPMGEVPLNLVITNDGFESSYTVYTDSDGSFSHTYTPASGASGIFTVRVVHPDLTDKPVHGQFTISRVSLSPTSASLSIPYNYEQSVRIKVTTGDGTEVNNLRLEYLADDQPGGEFPDGIHVTVGDAVATLAGGSTTKLPFSLWADNTADNTVSLVLRVASDENARWGTIAVNAAFSQAQPVLRFSPDHIETGMAAEDSVTETLTLTNKGLATMTDVQLELLSADGSAAPAWAVLNGTGEVGELAVGDEYEASVTFSPGDDVEEGIYSLILRVTSSNYARTDINIYASVTLSGIGHAAFKVSDIYTGTLDSNLQVIQGLSGARIVLENEAVDTESYTQTSDAAGEALFEDLPAGRYKARVTASNHQEYTGRIWIKPGITTTEDIFLEYNLVTVEWSVTETTVEDSYEIVLTATYETSVPAAVVGISPTSITLPDMQAGDVYNGEITLTNYGLIRADAVIFNLPSDDTHFSYEFSGSLPETIGARQQVTVPYRVTCLIPLEPDEDGSGGGCGTYIKCMNVNYGFECVNGVWTSSSVRHCWTRAWGTCSSGSSGSSGGSSVVINTGSGSGSSSGSYTPSSTTVSGVKCFPKPERKESFCFPCIVKDTLKHFKQLTGSAVNLWMREYTRDHVDLSVKAPGGQVEVQRRYYGEAWHFEHLRHQLSFTERSIGTGIQSIEKGGVEYEAATSESKLFVSDIYRIAPTETGYRWYDPDGNWKTFDAEGRMTAWGDRVGTVGSLVVEDNRVTGILDRDGSQVFWFTHDGDGNITAVSDSAGRQATYTYTGGLLTTVTDPETHETDYTYDSSNRLVRTVNAGGHGADVAYDSYGNVASVTDDDGEGWTFEYDYDDGEDEAYVSCTSTSGMVKETWFNKDGEAIRVDVNGRTVMSILKDGRDELVTGENGRTTRKNYDQWDNLTGIVYPDGNETSTTYNLSFGKPTRQVDENGSVTVSTYDDAGNLTRKVEASGTDNERITEYTYDDDGNLLTITRLADDSTVQSQTVMTYDDRGNLASVTDPEGGVTQFTSHDIMGNVLEKIDARGKTWGYTYDTLGRLKTVTDPLNNVTEHFYDGMGNRIRTVDAEGRETVFEYDNHDNLIRSVDHEGKETLFEYNSDNKLVKQTDPEGRSTEYSYDNEGRLIETVDGHEDAISVEYGDATGSTCTTCSGATGSLPSRTTYPTFEKSYTYDSRDRKVSEADLMEEDGGDTATYTTGFAYDAVGNLTSRTDKMGRTTYYTYDALNRLVKVTDPAAGETAYTYDDRDNLIALTDAENQTTRFEYDANNRLVKEIRPLGAETAYAYDAAGNLVEKIDAKNQKAEYRYDDAGRLEEIRYFADAGDTTAAKTVTFSYDKVGNLTGYDDGTTSAVYTYDTLYRKTAETVNYGAFSLASGYAYYDNGLKKTYTGPDSIAYGYLYDANNQLAAVQIPNAGYVTVGEYKWNRPASMLLPGGSSREFDYDPLMRVKQITASDPAANPVLNYAYEYDRMDNITAKATEHGDYGYTYDDLYRLTDADNAVQDDEAFTYDNVGNRLTSADTGTEWAYNENNELGGYDDVTCDYDLNGNMIEKNAGGVVTKFFYNLEDRLERVEDGSGNVIAEYYYDPFGRRLWKDVGGTRTCFHYSDEGLVGEYDASGNEIKTYGYKPGSTWSTDPLFMKIGTNYYYYHNDHIGTPQKMTSVSGAVVWSAQYSSFLKANVDSSLTITNNLRAPGQYYDEESELHYNYFRYYNPATGRYLTPDPIGLEGSVNLFAYVANSPIRLIDPKGLIDMTFMSNDFRNDSRVPPDITSKKPDVILRYWNAWVNDPYDPQKYRVPNKRGRDDIDPISEGFLKSHNLNSGPPLRRHGKRYCEKECTVNSLVLTMVLAHGVSAMDAINAVAGSMGKNVSEIRDLVGSRANAAIIIYKETESAKGYNLGEFVSDQFKKCMKDCVKCK